MMKRVPLILASLLVFSVAHAEVWQATYGVAKVFPFKLYNADGTLDVDEADSGTEVSLSCNQGAETTATNDFVDEGTHYSISLTAAELQCQSVAVVVAATTTEVFFIQTVGHASAFITTTGWETGDSFTRLGTPAGASIAADLVVIDNFTDDLESRLGTPSNLGGGATIAFNLSDIEAQTDDIGIAGAGLTAADDAILTRLGTPAGASVSVDIAAVKDDTAAVLDDTGTSGVLISSAVANCVDPLGCDVQGTLSGTHSPTTADLGTNAPTNDISGYTLTIPTHNFSRVIDSYDTGNGVATWIEATAVTLVNGNQYFLWATSTGAAATGGDVNVTEIEGADATDVLDARIAAAGLASGTDMTTALTRIGTPSNLGGGASIAFNLSDIEAQTDDLATFITDVGTNGAGLTALPWNTAWDTEVQSEANDAIVANLLDQLLLNTYNPATPPGAADSLFEDLLESDAGVTRFTANALENAPTGGGGGTSDWTAGEREQIRHRIGIDGDVNTPSATPSLATAAAVAEVEAQTDDIGVAGAGLTAAGMTAAQVRSALGLGSANLDTQLAALGTDLDTVLSDLTSQAVTLAALPEDVIGADVDGGRSLGCSIAAIMAVESGKSVTTDDSTTYYAPNGTTVRVSGEAPTPGNRTVTVTCP